MSETGLYNLNMSHLVLVLLVVILNLSSLKCETTLQIVPRAEWGARPPRERVPTAPATLVVIHHTYTPGACQDRETCILAMREIQDFHMDSRGWDDIGYNFAIGADAVYEGRGWEIQGAQAKYYNNHSVGIVFIGDYTDTLPSGKMMAMCNALIQEGTANFHILPDYQLIGHRQVRPTNCPGDALYAVVQGWSHWVPHPSGYDNSTSDSADKNVPRMSLLGLLVLLIVTLFKPI